MFCDGQPINEKKRNENDNRNNKGILSLLLHLLTMNTWREHVTFETNNKLFSYPQWIILSNSRKWKPGQLRKAHALVINGRPCLRQLIPWPAYSCILLFFNTMIYHHQQLSKLRIYILRVPIRTMATPACKVGINFKERLVSPHFWHRNLFQEEQSCKYLRRLESCLHWQFLFTQTIW